MIVNSFLFFMKAEKPTLVSHYLWYACINLLAEVLSKSTKVIRVQSFYWIFNIFYSFQICICALHVTNHNTSPLTPHLFIHPSQSLHKSLLKKLNAISIHVCLEQWQGNFSPLLFYFWVHWLISCHFVVCGCIGGDRANIILLWSHLQILILWLPLFLAPWQLEPFLF